MFWIVGVFGHIRRMAFAGLVCVLAIFYFAGPVAPVIGPSLEKRVDATFADAVRRSLAEADENRSASRLVIKQRSVLSEPITAPATPRADPCAPSGAVQRDRLSQRTDWRLYTVMLSVITWLQGGERFDRVGFERAVDEVGTAHCKSN